MSKISILIVEDEGIVAESLGIKLEQLGYEVAAIAANGDKGIEMALKLEPQLILMDIQLEGSLDGIGAAEAIQAQCDIPVIYLTAHSDPATLARARLTGPFGYILKPFETRDLAIQIELALYKHQADKEVREQREWLRVTLSSIGDAVIATDAHGLITFINPVAESLTGWKQEEANGRPVRQVFRIINEYSRNEVEDPASKVIRNGKIVGLANHTILLRLGGGEVPIDDSAAPITDDQGTIQGVVLVFRDITERRKAEITLRDSEERLQFALETSHIGAWELDLADHTAVRSLEHARIFGYENHLLAWSREIFLEHVLPEDRVVVKDKIQRAIETQSGFSFECRIRRADGHIRWIWLAGRHRVDAGGKARHIAGIVQDITERKAHETEIERLNRLYASLSQINQAIVRLQSQDVLFREVTRVTVEVGGFKMAWVGRHNPQTRTVEPLAWAGEQWEVVRNFRHNLADTAEHWCLCAPVVRENRSFVVNVLSAIPEIHDWQSVMKSAGVRAAAVFPVRVQNAVWGVFGIYADESGVFQDKEIALLEEAAMDIGYAIEHIENEAQRRQAEKFQLLSTTILGLLNEPLTLQAASNAILRLIKNGTDLDAVGIRLKDGDDFPYVSQEGLNQKFLLAENSVILRNETGAACRDANGQISLQCTCGMVLAEKCGPPSDHVTQAGSIWTNDSLALLHSLTGHDPRLSPRDRCTHEGYLSVALIPIRANQQVIGLLHLNDRRKDRFTLETIRFFEGLTASFGIAVERKRAETALHESDARFRALIDGAPEGVFVQCGGLFRYVNQAMLKLMGAGRSEDLLGHSFIERVAPEYHDAIRDRIIAKREGGAVAPSMEQEYLRLDRTRVPVETTAVAIRFQGQDGHLVFVHDITARREAAKERTKLEEQLYQVQKTETVGRLAGGIAHDFNNMLSIILGYGEMLLAKLRPGDPLRDDIQEMVAAGQRSASLTRQLLAFSRKQTLQPEILDLTLLVHDLDKMLRRVIGEDIILELALTENVGRVLADPGQIEQVILNLSVNARDAMPQGGKLLIETANVELDETYVAMHPETLPGKYVVLAVTDTGCGISKEILDKIFDPFFTTKEKGKGTGLGLSTVYGIVKQSGGNIWVYSEPGQGTTFKIYLPQTLEVHESAIAKAEVKAPATGRENILVVEDEESLRKLITNLLSKLGYFVAAAANGGEALLLVEEKGLKPDLVVTDVVMPNMSGKVLIDRLRRNYPHLKALYMSGYTDNAIVHHGVLDHGTPFIQKPFNIHDFAKKLREVLECASQQSE